MEDFLPWTLNAGFPIKRFSTPFMRDQWLGKLLFKENLLLENVKIASLTQNLIRRMKNSSELLENEERVQIVDTYVNQLRASGYSGDQRKRIIEAGLKGYETLVRKCFEGKAKMHRSAREGEVARRTKKLLGKSRWFKKKKRREDRKRSKKQRQETPEIVTVLFVQKNSQRGAFQKTASC